MSIISEHGYRQDGRKPHQIRNLNYKLGVYSQADGSAYLEQGNTKILCAVYGPYEPKQRSRLLEDRCIINCQYSMATFSTNERKERPRGDRRSLEFARLMEKAFEAAILTENYPRSQIDVFCELLQADGSHLAACVNVGTLALADAGVPMRGLIAAASCACTPDGLACVDVNSREEMGIIPRLTVATISGQDAIVLAELQNRLHKNHLILILEAARKATAHVHSCLEAAVLTHIKAAIGLSSTTDNDMERDNIRFSD
uniref:Putative exosome complex component RRP41 n=1 Tax=Onchocerca volvulus TaxID=6282 RepID=A0A8R1TQ00_ONCVO